MRGQEPPVSVFSVTFVLDMHVNQAINNEALAPEKRYFGNTKAHEDWSRRYNQAIAWADVHGAPIIIVNGNT